jgi:NTP pyrophosphatase (non-canonical NTP hydrolase)
MRDKINQCVADSQRWFPRHQTLSHLVLSLTGEAGELANLVKKVDRGSHSLEELKEKIVGEAIDVLVYLYNIMGLPELHDVDWEVAWNAVRAANEARFGQDKPRLPRRSLPAFVIEEAGGPRAPQQNWQTPGEFAS